MRRINPLFILACGLLFVACASTSHKNNSPEPPPLHGMAYDWDNQPLANARVSVDGSPAGTTDLNGRFAIVFSGPGNHRIGIEREGFEPASVSQDFSSPAEVIYFKCASAAQLRDAAEHSLAERRWDEADAFLDRAERVSPDDPLTSYLRAVICYRKGEGAEAKRILDGLFRAGHREPFLLLFRADVEQYALKDLAAAAADLVSFLQARYDPDVERRLAELRAAGK